MERWESHARCRRRLRRDAAGARARRSCQLVMHPSRSPADERPQPAYRRNPPKRVRDAELFARQSILLVGEPYAARVLTILSNQPVRKYLRDNNIPANAEIQAVPIMSHL